MGRQPCCDKVGLKRGPWTIEEDHKLITFILNNGIHCWRNVPKLAGLLRCGKSCRLRWINYLRPDLKRGDFTEEEENEIIKLHAHLGNRWSKIASHFTGRTDNEIKNHWNTRIKKKLNILGLDPLTHKPIESDKENGIRVSKDPFVEAKRDVIVEKNEVELSFDETSDLLDDFELVLCGGFDMEALVGLETNTTSSSNSSSSSTYSSLSPDQDSKKNQEDDCLTQWFDNVDYFLSWPYGMA